ncbi:DUF3566 domain-containing protein [Actinosynnema mirum]|uniref:DUF3566 domain-containing protein n=1 Tax=Actinosynnema mirum (strain ATCC 29888 / DSM 43827 / JCM 3225 / NBRC 14064 / NCIMB 13271 / NRRL B-12336 / IMRU 3971 / 101) TaxID=446462 RepID=C6WCG1_ACTMD|nr:DUF3566 domain-containing protein [Actinosynnema mirum]ACU33982.1 hypothetical protein Amir_0008 [Actinosynnema mirum DSM 43827]
MTPPEKEDRDADKTAVITRPSVEAAKAPEAAAASSGEPEKKPEEVVTTAVPAAAPEAAKAPEKPAEKPVDESPTVAVTPPPWQRSTSEGGYSEAAQVGPGDDVKPAEAGAPASPVFPSLDQDTVAVAKPVPPGAAPAAAAAAAAPRTAVNLGTQSRPQASSSARRPGRGPRRASLQVKRVDPWSVLKLALVLSVALFFVWLVAVGVLYGVLNGMGVWDKINNTANDLLQSEEASGDPLISAGRVFGVSAIVGAVNIVLFTALATVGAFVYNVSADLAGGLEVTLSERE